MWNKRRKTLLICTGILYVVFGILAFFNIPGGHEPHHHTFAHNLTHLFLGVILIDLALLCGPWARQALCLVLAAAYSCIALIGVNAGKNATLSIVPGVVEFHAEDYLVHCAAGLIFLALGLLKRSDIQVERAHP